MHAEAVDAACPDRLEDGTPVLQKIYGGHGQIGESVEQRPQEHAAAGAYIQEAVWLNAVQRADHGLDPRQVHGALEAVQLEALTAAERDQIRLRAVVGDAQHGPYIGCGKPGVVTVT